VVEMILTPHTLALPGRSGEEIISAFMQIILLKRQGCFFNSVALGSTSKFFKFQRSGSKASSLVFT
jgi:hypothetical protein